MLTFIKEIIKRVINGMPIDLQGSTIVLFNFQKILKIQKQFVIFVRKTCYYK